MGNSKLGRGEASEKDIWLYSLGNFSNNIIFMMVAMYVMFYYTNILGVSAAVAGTIFMVARLVDAVTDPLMGAIVDRTNTKRWGRYRPYIIFGAPLLGIAFVMMFTTPNFSPAGKIAYAYVSYIFYSLTWTCVQIPQLALPIMLSNSIARRTRIQAVFQAIGAVAAMIIQSWAIPMLDFFGGEDNSQAWTKLIVIYSIVATIVFILSAMSVRKLDVYKPDGNAVEKKNKVSLKDSFHAVIGNRALLCVLLAYGTDMFATQISNSLRIYFFKYNLNGRTDLMVYLGYVTIVAAFVMLFGIGSYVKKVGKRIGISIIEIICLLFSFLLLFATPRQNIPMVMVALLVNTFLFQLTNTLSRSAVLDAANFAEVKTGISCDALVSSTFTFVNKCCQAFSVFFAGTILTATGYQAELTQQAPGTLNAILYLMTIVPIAAYILSLVGMYFYPLNRKGEIELEEKIAELRARQRGDQEF